MRGRGDKAGLTEFEKEREERPPSDGNGTRQASIYQEDSVCSCIHERIRPAMETIKTEN